MCKLRISAPKPTAADAYRWTDAAAAAAVLRCRKWVDIIGRSGSAACAEDTI